MHNVYIYVVARDFGFAPNPFHGTCSLATCKPKIRNTAQVNDWIFGLGGRRLKAAGHCVFAMRVTQKVSYNEYWEDPEFKDKKPIRNGSKKMLLGDNIYNYDFITETWHQAHSHHSLEDGNVNAYNRDRDTKSKNVLLSKHFYYFGSTAPKIPEYILNDMGYKNKVGHRKFSYESSKLLISWLEELYFDKLNLVLGDPFDFEQGGAHYSVQTNKIILNTKQQKLSLHRP